MSSEPERQVLWLLSQRRMPSGGNGPGNHGKPGKKISITGNGRCNLTNRDIQDAAPYFSDAPKTADGILRGIPAEDTVHFFENAGLLMKEREGGLIYPYSDQAQSVVNALLQEVRRRKIKLKCQERVVSIEKKKNRVSIKRPRAGITRRTG